MGSFQTNVVFFITLLTLSLFGLSFIFSVPGVIILTPLALYAAAQMIVWWFLVVWMGGIDAANEMIKEHKDE
ncbi:hypothetical protein PBI_GRAYSON_175 [Rhodococcus phage Grayson]|jgi:hypothetical protein|nr:hypothetical protein PBI_GRAYSON_175 [Rhodococcus phage Grayson]